MSWTAILALAAGSYAFKALGLLVVGNHPISHRYRDVTELLPPALFAALIVVQTFESDGELVLDARAAGVAAAAGAVWLRAPFVVVILVAMAVTAIVRALA